MEKLGLDSPEDDLQSSLPPLPSDPFPFKTTPVNTGSAPASEERVADSTTGEDDGNEGAEENSEGDSDNSCKFSPKLMMQCLVVCRCSKSFIALHLILLQIVKFSGF